MPTAALRPCNRPGCPELVDSGYCDTHRKQREQQRPTAAQRGYDARHRRWRARVLARDPLCVHCKQQGRITPATEADHIVPITDDGPRFALDNGQGLCKSCHSRKTMRETMA